MRRYFTAPWMSLLLAVAAGLGGFVWKVVDLGESCGNKEGGSLPSFPVKIAAVVLVVVPVLLTVGRALSERRTAVKVVGLAALAAILAGAAFAVAELAFYLSRDCYQ